MAADPRGHRRHREHRKAGLLRIQQLHLAGHVILCCLCGRQLNPFEPYKRNGRRNPLAPTLEHHQPLSQGGPVFQPAGPDDWAHRRCQDRQGAQLRNTRAQRPDTNSRSW